MPLYQLDVFVHPPNPFDSLRAHSIHIFYNRTRFKNYNLKYTHAERNVLMQLEDENESTVHENYICPICQQLIFEPVVTSCGHSFCSSCLAKYIRHANTHQRTTPCPSCRAALPGLNATKMPVARVFADMIEHTYPREYQRRRDELAAESIPDIVSHPQHLELLAVFVLDATLPMQVVQ